eukprot:403365298
MQYFRLKAASPIFTVQNLSENQKDLWDKFSAIQQNQKDFPLFNERKDSQNFKIRIELQPLNLQQHQVEQALNNYKSTLPKFLICNRVIESVSFNEKKIVCLLTNCEKIKNDLHKYRVQTLIQDDDGQNIQQFLIIEDKSKKLKLGQKWYKMVLRAIQAKHLKEL